MFDLKEELATNLKEKIVDLQSKGMEEEQAVREAIISLGDLTGLIEDMRKIGQSQVKQQIYSSMTNRISTAGIVAGMLLILYGIFTGTMLYFMNDSVLNAVSQGIFLVRGGALLTYSVLTRETRKRYGMNKIRAGFYALAIGLILFSSFSGAISSTTTGRIYIGIAAAMVFFLAGFGGLLGLILTEKDHKKGKVREV